ncbi:phytanoyl-CoA dioxygenase family protein [Mucilaginibacter mali]|uniref:Phytanoyl-CoA dioxygenase family protein n=1 Tax=Mucilaginibacter mali TaxID=2740462 RepID=A0A7D4QQN5_9SPHI|nr:phytanoyl-CoA dioxygenase family protein [Mucilaginibacter mali]QKJ29209.1 phytanoyl-CoA dioxygenase family protein [Mucilaginibacter mali]
METETISFTALYKFWERNTPGYKISNNTIPGEWETQVYSLSSYGRGTEEALNYLYSKNPSFDAFIDWLGQTKLSEQPAVFSDVSLTAEDLDFWDRNGYLVVKNAVAEEDAVAARNAIWQFLDADITDPASWYKFHPEKKGLMLSFFQHTALEVNRRAAKIRQVYRELYGETDIYLLVDKVSFNPPETNFYTFAGSPLHWDVSLQLPIPFVLQGLLYLNDVTAADGAFHCVPGFHKNIDQWMAALPAGASPRVAALNELTPVAVPGKAGDLVIWHQALPHCATPNKGKTPRMVQYITYKPVKTVTADIWK